MKLKNLYIPLFLIAFVAGGALSVSAQDWKRLGDKEVGFEVDHDKIDTDGKGSIREIQLRVMKAPIKFSKVVINYQDGEKKELEYLETVEVGKESRSITIDGDGHKIKSVEFWYETDSLGGKKAKVSLYGRG